MDVKDKEIVIVGLARSGIAAATRLQQLGAHVTVTDAKSREALVAAIEQLPSGVELDVGGHSPDTVGKAELVVVSPGVPMAIPFLRKARARGVEVISEVELAYRLMPGEYVAVTGTNGKSTTTSLIGEMLKATGKNALVAGNIGTPLISLNPQASEPPTFVVELSSFQLEGVDRFRPRVAVLLNISPDHLDRYSDITAYGEAKARIFANQDESDFAVLNMDDPAVAAMAGQLRAAVVPISLNRPMAQGVYFANGKIQSSLPACPGHIVAVEEMQIRGVHNIENAMAATAAALVSGCDVAAVQSVLKAFPGLPHRMETVGSVSGVHFINDSKGTNVGAVIRSLESLDAPIHLIAGGQGKGSGYESLRSVVRERVRTLILIGEAAEAMARDLEGTTKIKRAGTLGEAVEQAFQRAQAGDYVLLSPACASFDMFRNFEDRGACFVAEVNRLKSGHESGKR